MSKISNLKKYLKEQAVLIKTNRTELKTFQKQNNGYDNGFFKTIKNISTNYRYYHIAYSLLKGKNYDQIEKPAENNKPDMSFIEEIKNAYTENVSVSAQ